MVVTGVPLPCHSFFFWPMASTLRRCRRWAIRKIGANRVAGLWRGLWTGSVFRLGACPENVFAASTRAL